MNVITNFMTEQRGWFVTFFVLPISLVYDFWYKTRAWVVLKWFSAPKLHQQRVKEIQQQLLDYQNSGLTGQRLVTARGGWQSITPHDRTYKQSAYQIRINLFDILELNEQEAWVQVEPMVNMGQLSHFLFSKNLTIPVVPELDDLTVGGLFMGVGIETSSHKYGLFNDTVLEAEVILADGTIKTCSRKQNRELFDALPWSYGTLGFLLSVKIRVIPCKHLIRIEYIPCKTREEGIKIFQTLSTSENPPQFIESLQYSINTSVVMASNYADETASDYSSNKLNHISFWYKPWFYKHVQHILNQGERVVEFIPLRDYLHRHTKSIFWELEDIIPFGNHPIYRWVLGWALPPKVSFLKITQTQSIRDLYEKSHIVQDMLVPLDKLNDALGVFHEKYSIYPLWLCPYRAYDYSKDGSGNPHRCFLRKPEHLLPGKDYEMYVDVGAYGTPSFVKQKLPFDVVKNSREVEAWVASVHGFQMLYATSYQTMEEFRAMFDHTHYDQQKALVDPKHSFPQIFEKTCKAGFAMWKKMSSEMNNKKDM
jgi:delta24-sterol reductase